MFTASPARRIGGRGDHYKLNLAAWRSLMNCATGSALVFPGGLTKKTRARQEALTKRPPFHPAITRAEREGLAQQLAADIAGLVRNFERRRTDALRALVEGRSEREAERERQRRETEKRFAPEVRRRRQKLAKAQQQAEREYAGLMAAKKAGKNDAQDDLPQADWPEWRPSEEISVPESQFGVEALLRELTPRFCQHASDLLSYECAIVVGIPTRQAEAHLKRAVAYFAETIFPASIPPQREIPSAKRWILRPAKSLTGAQPIELLLDAQGRILLVTPALYAQAQGDAEKALGGQWGILRLSEAQEWVRNAITERLASDAAYITADRRTRRQILEDFRQNHSDVRDEVIRRYAQVDKAEFYLWQHGPQIKHRKQDGLGSRVKRPITNRSGVHQRLIRVLLSPLWPPAPPPV